MYENIHNNYAELSAETKALVETAFSKRHISIMTGREEREEILEEVKNSATEFFKEAEFSKLHIGEEDDPEYKKAYAMAEAYINSNLEEILDKEYESFYAYDYCYGNCDKYEEENCPCRHCNEFLDACAGAISNRKRLKAYDIYVETFGKRHPHDRRSHETAEDKEKRAHNSHMELVLKHFIVDELDKKKRAMKRY